MCCFGLDAVRYLPFWDGLAQARGPGAGGCHSFRAGGSAQRREAIAAAAAAAAAAVVGGGILSQGEVVRRHAAELCQAVQLAQLRGDECERLGRAQHHGVSENRLERIVEALHGA